MLHLKLYQDDDDCENKKFHSAFCMPLLLHVIVPTVVLYDAEVTKMELTSA